VRWPISSLVVRSSLLSALAMIGVVTAACGGTRAKAVVRLRLRAVLVRGSGFGLRRRLLHE
jgi:hypothetical protein